MRMLWGHDLDSFVEALAIRIAGFDKWAIANTKRLVNTSPAAGRRTRRRVGCVHGFNRATGRPGCNQGADGARLSQAGAMSKSPRILPEPNPSLRRNHRHDYKPNIRRSSSRNARQLSSRRRRNRSALTAGSGANGQPAVFDRHASHGRSNGEIYWTRRRGARRGSGSPGGLPRGDQRPCGCATALGIASTK